MKLEKYVYCYWHCNIFCQPFFQNIGFKLCLIFLFINCCDMLYVSNCCCCSHVRFQSKSWCKVLMYIYLFIYLPLRVDASVVYVLMLVINMMCNDSRWYPTIYTTPSNCKLYSTIQTFCCVYFYVILHYISIYMHNMACFADYTLDFFTNFVFYTLDYIQVYCCWNISTKKYKCIVIFSIIKSYQKRFRA